MENEDTGVKAQGPVGLQGPVGPGGAQGLTGPKGETGDRGPQGIQGPAGATGPQGVKGDKGDIGPQGPKGDRGDTPPLTADLKAEVPGTALDATMGRTLDEKIANNAEIIGGLIKTGRFEEECIFSQVQGGMVYSSTVPCYLHGAKLTFSGVDVHHIAGMPPEKFTVTQNVHGFYLTCSDPEYVNRIAGYGGTAVFTIKI